MSPAETKAAENYQGIARAINQARRDVDAFSQSMQGVQGQLFQLRHGIDPQAIASVFIKGDAAASDFLNNLKEINTLVGRGELGQAERLSLVKGGITSAAAEAGPTQDTTAAATTKGEPDWVKRLVDGVEGANRHVLIEGMSGSGKSVMTRNVAFQRMEKGEEVHVVDTHTPEQWKGAASVFGAKTAGADAAEFLKQLREGFYARKEEAAAQGKELTQADFKPMTIVLSDFKKLLQDYPKLASEVNAMLQEGRKFNVSLLLDAASMSGIKGVESMLPNIAQKVRLTAEVGATGEVERKAVIGGKKFDTPILSDFKDRFDPSIIRKPAAPEPPPPPPPPPQFDPMAEAMKRRESERRAAQVREAYKEQFGDDDATSPLDKVLEVAGKFRGVIGGFAGALIGVGLDMVAEFQRAQAEVRIRRHDKTLVSEIQPAEVPTAPTEAAGTAAAKGPAKKVAEPAAPPAQALPAPAKPPAVQAPAAPKPATPAAPAQAAQVAPRTAQAASGTVAAAAAPPAAGTATAATAAASGGGAAAAGGAGAGSMMSALNNPVGMAVAAVVALGVATKLVADEMSRATERLSEYNATIAAATARAEVRQVYGDIDRANRIAPTLSKFSDAQSQLSQRAQDMGIQFMEVVGPAITELVNAANITIQLVSGLFQVSTNMYNAIGNLPMISEILNVIVKAWEFIKNKFGITDLEDTTVTNANVILRNMFAEPTSPGV